MKQIVCIAIEDPFDVCMYDDDCMICGEDSFSESLCKAT